MLQSMKTAVLLLVFCFVITAVKAQQSDTDTMRNVVITKDPRIDILGKKMAELSRRHQVLCITHLAQIAKYAAHHYRIEKEVMEGRTLTRITPLGHDERVYEIARMLGGDMITQTTLDHAKEVLGSARES